MMKRFFFFTILVFSCMCICAAFDFPCDVQEPRIFFGQKVFKNGSGFDGAFENGITFGNVNIVKASDAGEKILAIEKSNGVRSFPCALGNAIILLHENGFQTVYGNLASVQVFETKTSFLKDDTLGQTAMNAAQHSKPLIFKVIDINAKSKNFVNPILLLPEIADTKKCEIKTVFLQSADGKIFPLTARSSIPRGSYTLFIECFDSISNSPNRLVPFEINANLNGTNVSNITLQTLYTQNGTMYVQEKFSLAKMYQKANAYYLCDVELSYGSAQLILHVRDYSKNSTEARFELSVW